VGVTEKWRGAMKLEPNGIGIFLTPGPGAYATTALNLTYRLKPDDEIYLNIRNVFNSLAERVVGLSNSNGYPQTDDPIGRYFTVGVRFRY
jgi:outer membrane receptor protein involved in Fe transport